jgi:hypothetical protein
MFGLSGLGTDEEWRGPVSIIPGKGPPRRRFAPPQDEVCGFTLMESIY